jgi:hypothetical protein
LSAEIIIVALATGFYALAALALANWRDLTKDRDFVVGETRYFVEREIARVRLRFAGWAILGTAMLTRLLLPDVSYRSLVILGAAIVAVLIFGVEAVMGRIERRRILRGRGSAEELSEIGRKLDDAAREEEDRFSEGELEKREVRERVDTAAAVSKGELGAVKEELGAKIDEVIAMLRTREDGNG